MYFDIQGVLQALKSERKRFCLTIDDVAERSGLDRVVVSRLENGKQDNPTVATLMRYAAIGKRFAWSYENQEGRSRMAMGKRERTGGKGGLECRIVTIANRLETWRHGRANLARIVLQMQYSTTRRIYLCRYGTISVRRWTTSVIGKAFTRPGPS
jgi:transcriptional regulator with XRE-family HTH domain